MESAKSLSCQSPGDLERRLADSRDISWRNHGKRIMFYAPSFAPYRNSYCKPTSTIFPSISLTGTECALQCEHCRARLLRTMAPAKRPEDLWRILEGLAEKGGVGCLISGGCDQKGTVQLNRFLPVITKAKAELNLKIVVHTGLVTAEDPKLLAETGVDSALIDIIGSQETARDVYHLDIPIESYEDSLAALSDSGMNVVPHVVVGLHYGKLKGEYRALAMIARHDPAAVVLVAFTPLSGTRMRGLSPPAPTDIAAVLVRARELMPRVPLVLGCARPLGSHRIESEILGVKAGVNGVAYPTLEAIRLAEQSGITYRFSAYCCSLIFEDLAA